MTTTNGWAVRRSDGRVVVDCDPKMTELGIWEIALGWPAHEEIEWEKARGGKAFRCRVEEVPEPPEPGIWR